MSSSAIFGIIVTSVFIAAGLRTAGIFLYRLILTHVFHLVVYGLSIRAFIVWLMVYCLAVILYKTASQCFVQTPRGGASNFYLGGLARPRCLGMEVPSDVQSRTKPRWIRCSLQTMFTDFYCRNGSKCENWFLTSLFHGCRGPKRHFAGLAPPGP